MRNDGVVSGVGSQAHYEQAGNSSDVNWTDHYFVLLPNQTDRYSLAEVKRQDRETPEVHVIARNLKAEDAGFMLLDSNDSLQKQYGTDTQATDPNDLRVFVHTGRALWLASILERPSSPGFDPVAAILSG